MTSKKGFMSRLLNSIYWFVGIYVVAVLVGLIFGINEPTTLTTCVFTIGLGESGLTSLIQRSKLKSTAVLQEGDRHMRKILTTLYVMLGIYTMLALAIYYVSGLEPTVLTAGLFALRSIKQRHALASSFSPFCETFVIREITINVRKPNGIVTSPGWLKGTHASFAASTAE